MIYLAPVNHFDPLGRQDLIDRLRQLHALLKTTPGFVAVEYDPDHHDRIVRQRPFFREMVARQWPDLSPLEVDTLAQSLGYDGDAHRDVFPEANTIWLDRGRLSPRLECYAEDRLDMYRSHAGTHLAGQIPKLSLSIQKIAERAEPGNERDRCFAEAILSQLACASAGVVIVGANHTNEDVPDTMAAILRDRNVEISQI